MDKKWSKIKAEIVADFDNLATIGQDLNDEDNLTTQPEPYDPFENYGVLIALEKQKQKVVKKLRTNDRKKTDVQFREDLDADKHKALRALREILENPITDPKEKIAAAKTILSQVDKQRELDLKENADKNEDEREKARIILGAQINTDEMKKALSGMAPLLVSVQEQIKEENEYKSD